MIVAIALFAFLVFIGFTCVPLWAFGRRRPYDHERDA
jgi:hypothetical protein